MFGNKGRIFIQLALAAAGLLVAFVIVPALSSNDSTKPKEPTPPHTVIAPKAKGAPHISVTGVTGITGITGVNGAQLKKAQKIVACIQRANGDITKIQACAQRFGP